MLSNTPSCTPSGTALTHPLTCTSNLISGTSLIPSFTHPHMPSLTPLIHPFTHPLMTSLTLSCPHIRSCVRSCTKEPWGPDGRWHIDGYGFHHYLFSSEIGLVAIMLFTDVHPDGGGTAVAEGSHRLAARILFESGKT